MKSLIVRAKDGNHRSIMDIIENLSPMTQSIIDESADKKDADSLRDAQQNAIVAIIDSINVFPVELFNDSEVDEQFKLHTKQIIEDQLKSDIAVSYDTAVYEEEVLIKSELIDNNIENLDTATIKKLANDTFDSEADQISAKHSLNSYQLSEIRLLTEKVIGKKLHTDLLELSKSQIVSYVTNCIEEVVINYLEAYKAISEENILAAKNGDQSAIEAILAYFEKGKWYNLQKYMPVRSKDQLDDFIQTSDIAIYNCIRFFKNDNNHKYPNTSEAFAAYVSTALKSSAIAYTRTISIIKKPRYSHVKKAIAHQYQFNEKLDQIDDSQKEEIQQLLSSNIDQRLKELQVDKDINTKTKAYFDEEIKQTYIPIASGSDLENLLSDYVANQGIFQNEKVINHEITMKKVVEDILKHTQYFYPQDIQLLKARFFSDGKISQSPGRGTKSKMDDTLFSLRQIAEHLGYTAQDIFCD